MKCVLHDSFKAGEEVTSQHMPDAARLVEQRLTDKHTLEQNLESVGDD